MLIKHGFISAKHVMYYNKHTILIFFNLKPNFSVSMMQGSRLNFKQFKVKVERKNIRMFPCQSATASLLQVI